jgi:UDP-glucose 4-epimerase
LFTICGSDYHTKDGTCVRDYVHVADLAQAHLLALDILDTDLANQAFNIGGGSDGISVKELCKYTSKIVGKDAKVVFGARRAGDPAELVANISKAKEILKWEPKYSIHDIIRHAWVWEQKFETSK